MKSFRTLILAILLLIPFAAGAQALKGSYFLDNSINRNKMNPAFAPRANYVQIPAVGNLSAGAMSNLDIPTFLYPMDGGLATFLHPSVSVEQFDKALPKYPHLDAEVSANLVNFGFYTKRKSFWTFDVAVNAGLDVDIFVDIFFEYFRELLQFGQRQVFQNGVLLNAPGNQLPGNLVGAAEGKTLLHQIVRKVGGVDEALLGSQLHIGGVGLHGGDHGNEHLQAHLHSVHRIEDGLLILLHILVVGQGQTLQGGEQAHQVAVDTTGLATNQLCHVGILLLGHDGRAGGEGVAQLHELKLPAGPQNDLLGETAQVHHENGDAAHKLQAEIPVGNAVDGVSCHIMEP